jgi:hypothetical protein
MSANVARGLSLMAFIIAAGSVQAEPMQTAGGSDYAQRRIEAAFLVVEAMPAVAPVAVPMAVKGDLPPECIGPFRPEVQAECIDAAYEPAAEPPVIVETRRGATSILMRLEDLAEATLFAQAR